MFCDARWGPFRARSCRDFGPGAARQALAPGYLLPRLQRWFLLFRLSLRELESRISAMRLKSWAKTLGFWGFLFFLMKGLLWLTIPALIALIAN